MREEIREMGIKLFEVLTMSAELVKSSAVREVCT